MARGAVLRCLGLLQALPIERFRGIATIATPLRPLRISSSSAPKNPMISALLAVSGLVLAPGMPRSVATRSPMSIGMVRKAALGFSSPRRTPGLPITHAAQPKLHPRNSVTMHAVCC